MRKARKGGSRKIGAELARLAALPDAAIDTADIPEVRDWRGAVRGKFYRPIKQVVTIRLDADVVAWFKRRGPRYQTAVNGALREYMAGHSARQMRKRAPTQARGTRRSSRG
jgi:uncharacterized protein (DUF4415 family)